MAFSGISWADERRRGQRGGSGHDFANLWSKTLHRYGDIVPLSKLVKFDLISAPTAEREALLNRPVVQGFDPSNMAKDLRAGRF